ncbi:MAG TPA: DedA family protein [Candidatus Limnocylindrales bacterium]|jgi:membrane protein DedA with SNARE-associated domain
MLHFLDQIVIPFLTNLYDAVGYLGVAVAMAIESAMIPMPSEIILPLAGFQVSNAAAIEPLTKGPWNFWLVVIFATIGNTVGSLIGYAIGAWGGRPFLERWGKYLLIRQHEIELAEHFFTKYGAATAFFSRLLPVVRTFISFPAGVARMDVRKFIIYSTAGAFIWSAVLVQAGVVLGANWATIRSTLEPFDLIIAIIAFIAIGLFIWWRIGFPGLGRLRGKPAEGD